MARRKRFRIGETYGGSFGRSGRSADTVEWEWVHTGAEFARAHQLGKIGGGIWVIIGFVALHLAGAVYLTLSGSVYMALFAVIDVLALIALLRRATAAYVLVWVPLVATFPFSIPLVLYWVDGVRPNLIYRHRFERLVRPQGETAHV